MITPLFPYPAAMLKEQKAEHTLVVADLHIGWERALSERGIHVPTQMPKLLSKLLDLLSAHKSEKLLILGDVKYSVAVADMGEWHDVPDFFAELKKHVKEILLIRGNHDGKIEPLLPEGITILPASGVAVGDVGFFHGHKWPSPALLNCRTLVMGHVHPVVVLRDLAGFRMTRQVWIKAKCDGAKLAETLIQKQKRSGEETSLGRRRIRPRTSQLFIMPSFNDLLGGRPVNERAMRGRTVQESYVGPVLRSEAVDMENAETYLLDGTFLGTVSQLKALS